MDERKLLTTAVQPQPVKIMLFNARSTDNNTHTKGEHSACVKVRSEFRGSCVICGQRLTYLPCTKLKNIDVTDRKTDFKNQHWSVKQTVCVNASPVILVMYLQVLR